MIRKTIAAAVAGVVLAFAPTASFAYTPTSDQGTTMTVAPGQTAQVTFSGFAPGEAVTVTLTGQNAEGAVIAGTQSIEKSADGEGALSVSVTLPDDATGSYTLVARGQESGTEASIALETGVGASDGGAVAGPEELPGTGPAGNAALVIGASGLLLVGGCAVVYAARRHASSGNI